ncbi:hypothetical protein ACEWY4_003251 [Coilia grayii]|uniref:RBR-type E3 ubiquitin transferase n=1 Tax=Coilia grayii TaxID=363190 RepID=A0ABD1KQR1_9TELE
MMETAQEDELLAMESIFGPAEFRRSKTYSGGVMQVCPELSSEFKVIKKGRRERHTEYDLQHLPPLVVDFELPATYPSQSSPVFTLSCQWLSHKQLSKVHKHLYEMWQETGGGVVLFSWFQFLREELLSFLPIPSPWEIPSTEHPELGASSPDTNDVSDPQAAAASTTGTDLLRSLLDHNQKMLQRVFEDQVFECGICFLGKPGSECYRFQHCQHVFCKDCIANLFRIGIGEGSVLQFSCPNSGCDSVPSPSEVKELVGSELFSRYDQLLLQKTLDCLAGVVYCPRPSCSCPVALEPGDSWALCASCAFAFCTTCREATHGVDKCTQDPKRRTDKPASDQAASSSQYAPLPKTLEGVQDIWHDYSTGTRLRRRLLEERYGKKVLLSDVTNALSGQWIEKNTQECPSCSVNIEKTEGCNNMWCAACHISFCWRCLAILPKNNPYDHFRESLCSM